MGARKTPEILPKTAVEVGSGCHDYQKLTMLFLRIV
jgi:hypothetical protein